MPTSPSSLLTLILVKECAISTDMYQSDNMQISNELEEALAPYSEAQQRAELRAVRRHARSKVVFDKLLIAGLYLDPRICVCVVLSRRL